MSKTFDDWILDTEKSLFLHPIRSPSKDPQNITPKNFLNKSQVRSHMCPTLNNVFISFFPVTIIILLCMSGWTVILKNMEVLNSYARVRKEWDYHETTMVGWSKEKSRLVEVLNAFKRMYSRIGFSLLIKVDTSLYTPGTSKYREFSNAAIKIRS